MTGFINLTFCCQQATVITDFSDLEAIGQTHILTVNGGHLSVDELARVDGRMACPWTSWPGWTAEWRPWS